MKVKTLGVDGFMLGKQNVDLRYIEQLIDSEQTAALGLLLKYTVEHLVDGKRTISETAQWLEPKVRAGRNGICRRAWRYLRWIRNPKNSGDLFLPEPLSGVINCE